MKLPIINMVVHYKGGQDAENVYEERSDFHFYAGNVHRIQQKLWCTGWLVFLL